MDVTTLSACLFILSCLKKTERRDWERLLSLLKKRLHEMELSHLTTTVSALAQKGQGDVELWRVLDESTQGFLEKEKNVDPKTLTIILHGFALKGAGSRELYSRFAQRLEASGLQGYSLQGQIVCLWAFIKSKYLNKFQI
jgi:hypothetical protein